MLIDDMISSGHARALLGLESGEQQYQVALKIISEKLKNQVKEWVRMTGVGRLFEEEKQAALAEKDAVLAEMAKKDAEMAVERAKIKELEQQLDKPVEEPIKMGKTIKENTAPKSGALKYFE